MTRSAMKTMKKLQATLLSSLLLLSACGRPYTDTTLYDKNGQIKPVVKVLPCQVKSNEIAVAWDLSQEFTDELRRRVFESPKLYLERGGETMEIAKALSTPDPKNIPSAPLKDLECADFVMITELVEQRQTPYGFTSLAESKHRLEESGAILQLAFRVRVLDCRFEQPRVILQELLQTSQVVPKPYLSADYEKTVWGTEPFHHTPLGMAHSKLLREAIGHVEGYVVAAK